MKVYDKEIYEKQESIKFTLLIIVVFLIGFIAGYIARSFTGPKEVSNNTNNVQIENVESQRRLKTVFFGYWTNRKILFVFFNIICGLF